MNMFIYKTRTFIKSRYQVQVLQESMVQAPSLD